MNSKLAIYNIPQCYRIYKIFISRRHLIQLGHKKQYFSKKIHLWNFQIHFFYMMPLQEVEKPSLW